MKKILSIDCATKSLGCSIILFNEHWYEDISKINEDFRMKDSNISNENSNEKIDVISRYIDDVNHIIDNTIILRYTNVFDLIPGKKISDVTDQERAASLKGVLEYLEYIGRQIDEHKNCNSCDSNSTFNIVLLEFQEGRNYKSRFIYSCILYHFSTSYNNIRITRNKECRRKIQLERVGPSLKQSVYFEEEGKYEYFIRKYINNYNCNKNHSKHNFLYWINKKGLNHLIEGIKKKNIDDAGDSFLMAYAWIMKKHNIPFNICW
jgi:hypothetical protein